MREVINGEEGEQMKGTGEGRRAEEPRLEGNVAADRRFGTGTVTGPWAGGTWGCSPHGGGRNTDTAEHNDVMVSAAESLGVFGPRFIAVRQVHSESDDQEDCIVQYVKNALLQNSVLPSSSFPDS